MAVLLYHKAEKKGDVGFSGNRFYTSSKAAPGATGSVAYVVEKLDENSPPHLKLRGKFRIANVVDNVGGDVGYESFLFRLELEALAEGSVRIDGLDWFDWDVFRNAPSNSNIYGVGKVNKAFAAKFDDLLSNGASRPSTSIEHDTEGSLSEDIEAIAGEKDLSATERESLVKSRLGQGKFRKNVIEKWGGSTMCALSGVAIKEVLIASHIVPWRESIGEREHERLDGCNGILLSASIDKLFDSYLISFDRVRNTAELRASSSLSKADLKSVGIEPGYGLDPNMMAAENKERFFGYMQKHYEKFCEIEGLD